MTNYLRAMAPFSFTSKASGLPRVVAAGSIFSSDDPDLKGKEHLFEPVENTVAREHTVRNTPARGAVETATAAPGEKRERSTPATTSGAKGSGGGEAKKGGGGAAKAAASNITKSDDKSETKGDK